MLPLSDTLTAPFVGRTRELAIMHTRLAAVAAQHGGLVLIGGDAGIGKTALVATLARTAVARGCRVLVGHCYDITPPPPYGLWLDLFAGHDAQSLPIPLPAAFAHVAAPAEIAAEATMHAQLRQWLVAVTVAAPQTPLVLVLEDLHWSDSASLDLLRALARAIASLPVLILATYREDAFDRTHPLYLLLPRLIRETDAARITLRPLLLTDVYALVTPRYGLPEEEAMRLARYLQNRAEGNAFFIMELLYALEDGGVLSDTAGIWRVGDLSSVIIPSLLRQITDERVSHLGPRAHTLLESAAVIGGDIPLVLWARASGEDDEAVIALAERATAAHLLTSNADGTAVRFVHALVRDTLYVAIPLTRRRALHRAVADVLIARATADPGTVAVHLQAAGDPRALDWLLRAAARAESAAPASAMAYLESALALLVTEPETATQQAELHLRIAILGRFAPWTLSHLQAAMQLAKATGMTALAALADFSLAMSTSTPSADLTAAVATSQRALATLDALPAETVATLERVGLDATERTAMNQRYTQLLAGIGDFAAVFRLLDMTPDEPYTYRHFVDSCGYSALGITYILLGRAREGRAALADCTAWFLAREQYGSYASFNEWELNALTLVYETTDRERQYQLADTAERYYAQDDAIPDSFPPRLARVQLLAHAGEWDEALALINGARAALGFSGWYGGSLHVLGELAYARGERETALSVVREMFPAGSATAPGGAYVRNALHLQRLAAALALDADDPDAARRWLEAHDHWLQWTRAVQGQADGAVSWGVYYRATGDAARARAEADRALSLAAAPRQPLAILTAHRLLGELATDTGAYAEADKHLAEALALADACGAPYPRALTLIALGALQRVTGSPTTTATLAEARAICERLGAQPALRRIAALEAPPVPMPVAPTVPQLAPLTGNLNPAHALRRDRGLTYREIEVLALIAQGATNTGIAAALSLSVRTVERHIANTYAKIGAHNRAGAVTFALTAGIIPPA